MKKSVMLSILVVCMALSASIVSASVFEWSVFVQGGAFDRQIGAGCSKSCSASDSFTFPQNAFIYFAQGSDRGSDSCSHSSSAVITNNLYSGSAPGVGSREYNYEPVSTISGRIRGSDSHKYFSGGSIRRTCHYNFGVAFKYGVQIFNDDSFVTRRLQFQPREYGSLNPRIPANVVLGQNQVFKVYSHNPKVMMWFGTPDSYNITTTTDTDALIFACEDVDINGQCDYLDEEECLDDGGDWYAGQCCGVTANIDACNVYSNFQRILADGTLVQNITPPKPAVCGLNQEGNFEWAFIEDVGNVHELIGCPDPITLVSDGTDYYACGGANTQIANDIGAKSLTTMEVTFGGKTHEFSCVNNKISECPGDDLAMSENVANVIALGEQYQTPDGTEYCTDQGVSAVDLDKSPLACANAIDAGAGNEHFTGHYCCSEDLDAADANENYNNPFDPTAFFNVENSSAGGCFDREFYQAGSWLVEDKVVNAQGVFWGCDFNGPEASEVDTHTGVPVIQTLNTCDKVDLGNLLEDADGKVGQYAVCQPWGEIRVTDDATPTIKTGVQWNQSQLGQNQHSEGCCPENQCWNGDSCQPKGSYYQVGAGGFACN